MRTPPTSLVGRWYACGPSDKLFDPDDREFAIHRVVADDHDLPGCVTIENPAGQRSPLERAFAERIAIDVDPRDYAVALRFRARA